MYPNISLASARIRSPSVLTPNKTNSVLTRSKLWVLQNCNWPVHQIGGGGSGQSKQTFPFRQSIQEAAQKIRDIYLMLDQCWASVYDAGPALVQHWVDVSCLLTVASAGLGLKCSVKLILWFLASVRITCTKAQCRLIILSRPIK